MSNIIRSRLPPEIRHAYKIYEKAAFLACSLYRNPTISRHVTQSSDQYKIAFRTNLVYGSQKPVPFRHVIDENDFPLVIANVIKPLFDLHRPIDLGLENTPTADIFIHTHEAFNASTAKTKLTQASSFQKNTLASLASHSNPYKHVLNNERYISMFRWYYDLLRTAPVAIFLRQKNRLFSETSIYEINKPEADMRRDLRKICLSLSGEKKIRNYHFTNLLPDIFSLAVKSETEVDSDVGEWAKNADWSLLNMKNDALCDKLLDTKCQLVQTSDGQAVPPQKMKALTKKYRLEILAKEMEKGNVRELYPYDVEFESDYVLTIENPVVAQNHQQVLELLTKYQDDFTVMGVRLDTQNEHVKQFFDKPLEQQSGSSYEDLLRAAQKRHETHDNSIDLVVRRMGELGLLHVEEGCGKNCVYLL